MNAQTPLAANIVLLPPEIDDPRILDGGREFAFGGDVFGTSWQVRIVRTCLTDVAEDQQWMQQLKQKCVEALVLIDGQMSPWKSHSDLSRFNASAVGSERLLPEPMGTIVANAIGIAELTDQAFDPFLYEIVELWGFGARPALEGLPAKSELERIGAVRKTAGDVSFEGGVLIKRAECSLDLCGIAKGQAVDILHGSISQEAGAEAVLVEIGGEFKGHGVKPDGMPWWVEIDKRDDTELPRILVALHGWACATSGSEQRQFIHDGRRFSHVIDPKVMEPVQTDLLSVSVFDRDCWRADALATALFVMGRESAFAFAQEHQIACLLVTDEGNGDPVRIFSDALAGWQGEG